MLDPVLRGLIRHGSLRVIDWRGSSETYGDGQGEGIVVRVHDRKTGMRLLLDPQLEAGEAYMDGRLTIERGTLHDFLDLLFRSIGLKSLNYPMSALTERLRDLMRVFHQFNPSSRSLKNVAHHYDLSDRLYDLFLDADRQYSCGYFATGDETLEECQELKKLHIAAKLMLRPDDRVLDIGSGWGGLGLTLAEKFDVDVTGLTLSTEQHTHSNLRARDAGLAERVRFEMRDYRCESRNYDRIVSVGMFEHVGVNYYGEFFRKVSALLTEDGIALIHSIGRPEGPGHTNPWIAKHIFPGGYSPALSEVLPAIEKAGLFVTDIEILRMHYADTLRLWRERFEARRDEVRGLYDERFCRMWEFYLVTSELSFRHQGQMVFQIQLAKRPDVVPVTRDYIHRFEVENRR
ncbi:MAG: cyclopropane-fatty-acyl-phospholipid synthase family protein [Verrucomicrobiota bacterium]